MAKLKLTKTELKAQTDDLKRFVRFLPTLQLKKQQLQLEMRRSQAEYDANKAAFEKLRNHLRHWTKLLGDEGVVEVITGVVSIKEIITGVNNIAGVNVPIFDRVEFELGELDIFATDFYISAAVDAVCELVSLVEAGKVLKRQYELLEQELIVTSQRVNLFEKVKIPQCKENIRKIRIYMSDQETSAVARSKMAKAKTQAQATPSSGEEFAA